MDRNRNPSRYLLSLAACAGAALVLAGCGGTPGPSGSGEAAQLPNGGVVRFQEGGSGQVTVAVFLSKDQSYYCYLKLLDGPFTVAHCLETFSGGDELPQLLSLPQEAADCAIQCERPEDTDAIIQADGYGVVAFSFDPETGALTGEPTLTGWEGYPAYSPPQGSAETYVQAFEPFQWEEN